MTTDGPGTPSITERLKARSEADARELETATRIELTRLAESLKASSSAALKETGESIRSQITEIEERVSASRTRILSDLAEIEIRPRRAMRRTMIASALTGAVVATIPWAVMATLGMSATEATGTWLDRRAAITREETRINALEGIEIKEIDGQAVLMLPPATRAMHLCGETRTPCIRIGE